MLPATASRCAVVPRARALLWLSFAMRRTAADGWRAEGQSGLDSAPTDIPESLAERPRDVDRRYSAARLDYQGVAAVYSSFSAPHGSQVGGEWLQWSNFELCTKRFTAASKAITAAFLAERGRREQCVA